MSGSSLIARLSLARFASKVRQSIVSWSPGKRVTPAVEDELSEDSPTFSDDHGTINDSPGVSHHGPGLLCPSKRTEMMDSPEHVHSQLVPPSPPSDIDPLEIDLQFFPIPQSSLEPIQDLPIVEAETVPPSPLSDLVDPFELDIRSFPSFDSPLKSMGQSVIREASPAPPNEPNEPNLGSFMLPSTEKPPLPAPVVKNTPRWTHFRLPIPKPEDECTCGAYHTPPYVYYPAISPPSGINLTSRLPNEVLYLVFMACCTPPSSEQGYYSAQVDKRKLATILGRVCKRWRSVILGAPTFWSYISAVGRFDENIGQRLETCLSRARPSYPLIVEFGPTSSFIPVGPIVEDCLQMLLRHSHRWKSLRLLHTVDLLGFFSKLSKGQADLPLLRRLELSTGLWKPIECVPWYQLTHLSLECPISGDEVLGLLELCPRLTYLSLNKINATPITPPDPEDSDEIPPITLFDLRTLSLTLEDTPTSIFDRLKFPALETLRLATSLFFRAKIKPDVINTFLLRSGCTLLSFTLSDLSISTVDLMQWLYLPSIQSIHQLNIQSTPVPPSFIHALQVSNDWDMPLLPMLEDFEMDKCASAESSLFDMAMSRCQRTGKFTPQGTIDMKELKFLKATLDNINKITVRAPFSKLKEAGMRVEIDYAYIHRQDDSFLQPLDMDALLDDPLW